MIKANWSGESAFNLDLALTESLNWIENVLGVSIIKKDGAAPIHEVFQTSLKDGVLLCKLINQIKAGTVAKINLTATSDAAKRENLSFFIKGGKGLGLRDTQLFDTSDLYESKRIRNVAISLYWLGRAARGISTYKGPQLNLLAFQKMNCSACKTPINDNNYLATLTQQWHTACAKCCNCNCNLDPKKQFFMEGNNIWCPDCMVGATQIGGSNSGAGKGGKHGNHAHKHGDNECVSCHGGLEKGYVPEVDGSDRKYCTKCICDACHNPLIGNFNIKNGKKICDDCSCSSCGKSLEDGFFEMGISKFCEPCAHKKNEHDSKTKPTVSTAQLSNTNSPTSSPNKSTTTTTTNNNNNNNSNSKESCKQCHKPIDKKVRKGNDRDKFCEPHEHDKCCGKCDKEIHAQTLEALGKNWHPNCFTCEKCNKKLGPSDTIKKSTQGNPVCGPCSSGGKSSCHECNKPVSGQGVEALDHVYHPECFKCHSCDKKLADDFQEVDDEAFCVPCAKDLSKIANEHGHSHGPQAGSPFITSGWGPNDKCVGCVKPLNGMVAKLDNQYWHKGCFFCTDCKCALLSGFFPLNKKPYCKGCYDKNQTTSICSICNKTILYGHIVKTSTKEYHKECFDKGCTTCKKPLSAGQVYTKFSKPYCGGCFQKDTNCSKCKTAIKGEYYEKDNQIYCPKCQPSPVTSTIYGQRQAGFTVDPRSGKKTFH
ncbi:hypothetical protein CYY_009560 [Polysphondylium violaceum]|uniref:LIM-type zinc finger-containing protein n=1 Tax=Polysphondylium violaceum TaxID=133409 RepID=A0A8J4PK11_9MYCE|nr:hypothetical protein CYY_009560 [Polysphondylium violaceum]